MIRYITPDPDATVDVDPALDAAERIIEHHRRVIEDLPDAARTLDGMTPDEIAEFIERQSSERNELIKGMIADLDDYKANAPADEKPFATIGYIKPALFTRLRNEAQANTRKNESQLDDLEFNADWARRVVRAGLRAFRCYGLEPWTSNNGETAPDYVLDAIERMDWLQPLGLSIVEYNNLSAEEKKRS